MEKKILFLEMEKLPTESIQIFQVSLILILVINFFIISSNFFGIFTIEIYVFFLKPSVYMQVHNEELAYRRDYVWMDSRMRIA